MATPKKKTITKHYIKDLQLDFYSSVTVDELETLIKIKMSEIEVEMEEDGLSQDTIDMAYQLAKISFNRNWGYHCDEANLDVTLSVSAAVSRMETQKEADLREKRSEKAKKTREENLRKEREMKVLEMPRNKYGV